MQWATATCTELKQWQLRVLFISIYRTQGKPMLIGDKNFTWDGIFKLLRSPGIDTEESIPPAYVAWDGIFKLVRSPAYLA